MATAETLLRTNQLSRATQNPLQVNDLAALTTMLETHQLSQIVEFYFASCTTVPTLDVKHILASNPDIIDVKKLIQRLSPDEMKRKAEEYFSSITNTDYLLAKPFGSIDECPELLMNFASVVQSGAFVPGQVLLEFGAGSSWVGRLFNQMGLEVISLDISATALTLGKTLKDSWPVFGSQPKHTFLEFDGYTIDLPDASVDRVVCFDSFHHVANPERILQEFYRILKPNGLVAFSEPGPYHSLGAQSQEEMKKFSVIENNVDLEELWPIAQNIGFDNIFYSLISTQPEHIDFENYKKLKYHGLTLEMLVRRKQHLQNYNFNTTKFFISKGKIENADSRSRDGLTTEITILSTKKVNELSNSPQLAITFEIKNTSKKVWLKSGDSFGSVSLGAHLFTHDGEMIDLDYFRYSFLETEFSPGESLTFECLVPIPQHIDSFVLDFDLVSHNVIWFAANGSHSRQIHWPLQ